MKKIFFTSVLVLLSSVNVILTHAESDQSGEKHTFTITGYYSPLPDQNFYITGSYESEIRLNGRGIRGADGTPVYPGMIAAPRSYPFGTKICIPNFGCGTVHDRGGAIVNKGERELARHDRLDLWMGYGEQGLLRALAWGVPDLDCEMFPAGSTVEDSVNFEVPMPLNRIIDIPAMPDFSKNLSRGDKGIEVEKLQRALNKIGLYGGLIDGVFDDGLRDIVFAFQKKYFIVNKKSDRGVGVFGPKTRNKLSEVLHHFEIQKKIRNTWEKFHFEEKIAFGSRSKAAFKLQEILVQGELMDHTPTGYFGEKTKAALVEFQKAHEIINSENDLGAGIAGEKTLEKLNAILAKKKEAITKEKKAILAYQKSRARLRYFAGKYKEKVDAYARK